MAASSPQPNASGVLPVASQADPGPPPGFCALGTYRILRSLGCGGMSEVYLAYDSLRRCQVAVKVLSDNLVSNQAFVNRFLQEGRLEKELTHPNLVKAFDFGCDAVSGKCFIAMECIDGLTAQELLERDGRLPVANATAVVLDVAQALEYVHHNGYVHRDIKPGNILIGSNGHAKLIDLGVAKEMVNSSILTSPDQGVGTPYYMPWEQTLNSVLVDGRSDIFALGATFYHLLTGHVPFPGDDETTITKHKMKGDYIPIRQHNRHLPAVLETILDRMLARDPRRRFSSCREVIEILGASGMIEGCHPADLELPSFVEQPLTPTRADLPAQVELETPLESGNEQLWLVKFQRPEDGAWRKVRAGTLDVIRLYEDGTLPDAVFAARQPSKVFRNLKAYPEFRSAVRKLSVKIAKRVHPMRGPHSSAPMSSPGGLSLGLLALGGGLTLLVGSTALVVMRLLDIIH